MRLEQETYINPARLNFLSLPNGEELYLHKGPVRTIVELLIEAAKEGKQISREGMKETLKPAVPDINNKKLGILIAQATGILKPAGLAIIGEEAKGTSEQITYLYALGTLEQKLAQKPKKREPQTAHRKQPELEPNPESKNGKKPAAKFEWPDQKEARLAREPKVREEEREVFVIKFSSIVISQIANNPEDDFYHATNLDKDLEDILKRINPDFKEIIDGDSPEYLRDFFLHALLTKFTEWWNVENLRNIPVLEKLAVENTIKLKSKGLNIQDILNQVAEHFKFPIASADLPKPKKI